MDFATFDYMTDDGQKICISLATLEGQHKKTGHDMSVLVDVDGVRRLASDTHFSVIDQFGLGEYLVEAIVHCLHDHLREWLPWQELAHSFMPDESVVLHRQVPIYESNIAVRHIRELDDVNAFWWMSGSDDPGHDGDPGWNGYSVLTHLRDVGKAAFDTLANSISEDDFMKLFTSER